MTWVTYRENPTTIHVRANSEVRAFGGVILALLVHHHVWARVVPGFHLLGAWIRYVLANAALVGILGSVDVENHGRPVHALDGIDE